MTKSNLASLPLYIGVIGHTKLPSHEIHRLSETLNRYLQNFRTTFPHTPIKLITTLLPGAELLAAEVALELGMDLMVVLAFKPDEFLSQHSLYHVQLEAVLNKAEQIIELPRLSTLPADAEWEAESIRLQYLSAGAWLCRHSHEMIALWDNNACNSRTSCIAGFRLGSIPPYLGETRSLLHATEIGPLIQIPLHNAIENKDGYMTHLPADLWNDQRASSWKSIDRLNREVQNVQLSHTEISEELADYVPQSFLNLSEGVGALAQLIVASSYLASKKRAVLRRILAVLFVVTGVGVLALQAISMTNWQIPMANVYSLFFMAVGSLYVWGRTVSWNSSQLEYQALAEILSVKVIWRTAGVSDAAFDHLLPKQAQSLHWVREALRSADIPSKVAFSTMTPGASLSAWITHKKVIHELASRRLSAKYKLFQKLVYGFYGVSLLLTLVILLSPPFSPLYAGTLSASLGISASFGTLCLIFSGVMGYGGSAAAHEYMLSIFSTASHLHKQVLPAHEEFELLVDLGKEAIQSAADWVMIHR